eukprot:SAG11_NODE_4340_length_1941_cov_12.763844_2_plen_189_part_00
MQVEDCGAAADAALWFWTVASWSYSWLVHRDASKTRSSSGVPHSTMLGRRLGDTPSWRAGLLGIGLSTLSTLQLLGGGCTALGLRAAALTSRVCANLMPAGHLLHPQDSSLDACDGLPYATLPATKSRWQRAGQHAKIVCWGHPALIAGALAACGVQFDVASVSRAGKGMGDLVRTGAIHPYAFGVHI